MNFSTIRELVSYYRVTNISNENGNDELVSFSITFDKDKVHNLFYKMGLSYSEISDKELYILPILIRKNQINIFNNNFFYENWNKFYENDLIEFILPLENIEILQNINNYKNNLLNLSLENLFEEYQNKNLALIFIDDSKLNKEKIYIKTIIQGKNISQSLNLKKKNLSTVKFNEKIIIETKKN